MRIRIRDWRLPLLTGVAYLFARLSSGRLPHFLFYATAGILIVSLLWTWRVLRALTVRVHPVQPRLQSGERLAVRVEIENRSFLPVPWLEIDDMSPPSYLANPAPHYGIALPVRGRRVIGWEGQTRRRGHYLIGPVQVASGDPFGLFRGERQVCGDDQVTVYPRVTLPESCLLPLSRPLGSLRSKRRVRADHGGLAGIRPYRPGDNPRHIHWKSSAHTGTLMLREFDPDAGTRVLLLPDMAAASYPSADPEESVETVVETAAALAAFCLQKQIECQLLTHAQERFETSSGKGERTFHEILEVLARVEARGQLPAEEVLKLEAGRLTGHCTLALITPRLSTPLAEALSALQRIHPVMLILVETGTSAGTAPVDYHNLLGQLACAGVHVYQLPARDAIARMADYRVTMAPEVGYK